MKKIYRIELLSDSGDFYAKMATGTEKEIKRVHGDVEGAKIITGKHDKWHLTQTFEAPDPKE